MGEGWSVDRRDLIPSDSKTGHPDPRMHLRLLDMHKIMRTENQTFQNVGPDKKLADTG